MKQPKAATLERGEGRALVSQEKEENCFQLTSLQAVLLREPLRALGRWEPFDTISLLSQN